MTRRAILVCLDGCGPEYLSLSSAPFLKRLGREGYFVEGSSMIPSVTNVNNVSILTGKYPKAHGITSNYYYDRETGKEVYMESPEFIKVSTILEQGAKRGLKTALLASKEKLRLLLSKGATISFSAEKPTDWVIKAVGQPPSIYSVDVNIWLFKALQETIRRQDPALVFVATTDYAMHMYGPRQSESKRHMKGIDRSLHMLLEKLETKGEETLVCITADHGMSEKKRAVNLELILKRHGIHSRMNPIIADRYVIHHRNLGGAVYIYLKNTHDTAESLEILRKTEGVEAALTRDQAERLYHLDGNRIGDLLALGKKSYVFGLLPEEINDVSLRSHGSLHERKVPIITNLPKSETSLPLKENKDLAPLVLNWLTHQRILP